MTGMRLARGRRKLLISVSMVVAIVAAVLAFALKWLGLHGAGLENYANNHPLRIDGETWAELVAPEYDPAQHRATYKPYTALLAPGTGRVLTKGVGGIDTHHRGLYLGWNAVEVEGKTYDFWHMASGVYQQQTGYAARDDGGATARIAWCLPGGKTVLEEERSLRARVGEDGTRCFDFTTTLRAVDAPVRLRGDLHHAGMHVRLSNEVCFHPWSTRYILPEDASARGNSRVTGAWWVCCSARVSGRRYWFMHMTDPAAFDNAPVYSTRAYGRFGAFWEVDLRPGEPRTFRFGVLLSTAPLDRATCGAHYAAFTTSPAPRAVDF